MIFARAPRALLTGVRARYNSTAAEASSSTTASAPSPFAPPPSQASSTTAPATSAEQAASRPSTSSTSASPSSSSPSSSVPQTPRSDSDLSPVFGRHVPLKPTHGVHVATLHLRSYTDSVPDLQFFTSFALRAARALGLPTSGAVALPTRTSLFTVPRSPFAHKKSQQNFWRKEHKRAIKVWDGNEEVVQAWLAYLRREALGGVGMKAQVFTYRPVGWGQKLGTGDLEEVGEQGLESEVERLAKDLQEELEAGIEEAEKAGQNVEPPKERQELEEVEPEKAKPTESQEAVAADKQ
ncbi:hypothetical protein JCM10212_004634 [Sporobolomyces blumeae]